MLSVIRTRNFSFDPTSEWRTQSWKRFRKGVPGALLGALLVVLALFALNLYWWAIAGVGATAALLGVAALTYWIATESTIRHMKDTHGEQLAMTFDRHMMIIQYENGRRFEVPWEDVTKVKEDGVRFLFHTESGREFEAPFEAFAEASDMDKLRSTLRKHGLVKGESLAAAS